MGYDLNNETERKELSDKIQQWIVEDDLAHTQRHAAWNQIDNRLSGDITTAGWSQNYISDLLRSNDPRTAEAMKGNKQFVTLNRASPNQEAVLGDFINKRRKLSLSGATPKDRNLAKVLRARIEYIESSEMLPELVYFPAFDNAFTKGLGWIEISYNPRANMLKGKFDVREVSCRDVLVDCRSRGIGFLSAKRITTRIQLGVAEATKRFRKYRLFGNTDVSPDAEYDRPYSRKPATTEQFATFYKVQFKETINHYYMLDPQTNQISEEIDERLYDELSDNIETANLVFPGEEEEVYYVAFYHQERRVFHLEQTPYKRFTIIPLINFHRDGQLYPGGDVEVYANLLDLLDVLISVFLETSKRTNLPIAEVDENIYARFQEVIDSALEHGGAAPGIKGLHYPQINAALTQLIPLTLGWIQDSVSKHAASMGELPSKQIAKETIQTLIAKDRQAHGRKDVMINLTLTQLAKLLTEMVTEFDTEPDFFQVADAMPGQIGYVPVNQRWLEAEFLANLQEMAGLPEPQTPEEVQAFGQQIQALRKKFEMENDIDEEFIDGYIIPSLPEGAREFKPEELSELIQKSGLQEDEFSYLYNPQQTQLKQYVINNLSRDVDLNIRYSIDTDYENDPEFRANRAIMMSNMGKLSTVDLYKELKLPNPEELIENLQSENQALQLAKALASRPDIVQVVQRLVQGGNGQQPPSTEQVPKEEAMAQ